MATNIKQSETKTIMRSQIHLNALNPKRHVEEAIKTQARNIKKVGILGGIVVNANTNNILDGHRRVLALDQINKYDGTQETDYELKVEVCHLSDKEEKEQMTYMAVGNTQADLDLIAKYIGDIDTKDIGLTEAQIKALEQFNISEEDIFNDDSKSGEAGDVSSAVEDFFNFLPSATVKSKDAENLTPEEKKAKVLEGKALNKENIERYDESTLAQITLSFDSFDNKATFCEMLGIDPNEQITKGESVLELIQ